MARIFKKWFMSPATEIFVYGMAGITITAMEHSVLNASEYLKEVRNAPLPAGYFGPMAEQYVKTILSLAVLARSYTVCAYLFAYFAVLGVAFFGRGRFLLLPWLLLSVLRHFVVDVAVALTGVFICFKYHLTPVCGEFIAIRLIRIGTAAYMWRSVRMLYDELALRASRASRRRSQASSYVLSQESTRVLNRALQRIHMAPCEEDLAAASTSADADAAASSSAWDGPGVPGRQGGSSASLSVSSKPMRRHISAGITSTASVDCANVRKREVRAGEDEGSKLPFTRSLESLLSMLDYNAEALAPLVARRREERRAGEGASPRQRALFFLRLTERDATAARRRVLRALVGTCGTTPYIHAARSFFPLAPTPSPPADAPEKECKSENGLSRTAMVNGQQTSKDSTADNNDSVAKCLCPTLGQTPCCNTKKSKQEMFELSSKTESRVKEQCDDIVQVSIYNNIKESISLKNDLKSETETITEIEDSALSASNSESKLEDRNATTEFEVETEDETEIDSIVEDEKQSKKSSSKNRTMSRDQNTEINVKSSGKTSIEPETSLGEKGRENLKNKHGDFQKEKKSAERCDKDFTEQLKEGLDSSQKVKRNRKIDLSPSVVPKSFPKDLRKSSKSYSSGVENLDLISSSKLCDSTLRPRSRERSSRLKLQAANSRSRSGDRDVSSRSRSRDTNSRPGSRDSKGRHRSSESIPQNTFCSVSTRTLSTIGKSFINSSEVALAPGTKKNPFCRKLRHLKDDARDDSKPRDSGVRRGRISTSKSPESKIIESNAFFPQRAEAKISGLSGQMPKVADSKLSRTRDPGLKISEGSAAQTIESKTPSNKGTDAKSMEPKFDIGYRVYELKDPATIRKCPYTKTTVPTLPENNANLTRTNTGTEAKMNVSKAGRCIPAARGQVIATSHRMSGIATFQRLETSLAEEADYPAYSSSLPVNKNFVFEKTSHPEKKVRPNKTSVHSTIAKSRNKQDIFKCTTANFSSMKDLDKFNPNCNNINIVKSDVSVKKTTDSKFLSSKKEGGHSSEVSNAKLPISGTTLHRETNVSHENHRSKVYMKVTNKEIKSNESSRIHVPRKNFLKEKAERKDSSGFRRIGKIKCTETNNSQNSIIGKQSSKEEIMQEPTADEVSSLPRMERKPREIFRGKYKKSKDIVSRESKRHIVTAKIISNDSSESDTENISQETAFSDETNSRDVSELFEKTESTTSNAKFLQELSLDKYLKGANDSFLDNRRETNAETPYKSITEDSYDQEHVISEPNINLNKTECEDSGEWCLEKSSTNLKALKAPMQSCFSTMTVDNIKEYEINLTGDSLAIDNTLRCNSSQSSRSRSASFISINLLVEDKELSLGEVLSDSLSKENPLPKFVELSDDKNPMNSGHSIHRSSLIGENELVNDPDNLTGTAEDDIVTILEIGKRLGSAIKDPIQGDYPYFVNNEFVAKSGGKPNAKLESEVLFHSPVTSEICKKIVSEEASSIVQSILIEAVNTVCFCSGKMPLSDEPKSGVNDLETPDVVKVDVAFESYKNKAQNEEATSIVRSVLLDSVDSSNYVNPSKVNMTGEDSTIHTSTNAICCPRENGCNEENENNGDISVLENFETSDQRPNEDYITLISSLHENMVGAIKKINSLSNIISRVESSHSEKNYAPNQSKLLPNKEKQETFSIVHSVLKGIVLALDIKKSTESNSSVELQKDTLTEMKLICDNEESKNIYVEPVLISDNLSETCKQDQTENEDSVSVVKSVLQMVISSVTQKLNLNTSSSDGNVSNTGITSKIQGLPTPEDNKNIDKDSICFDTTRNRESSSQKENHEAFSIVHSVLKEIFTAVDRVHSTASLTSTTEMSERNSLSILEGSPNDVSTKDRIEVEPSIDINKPALNEKIIIQTPSCEANHIIGSILSDILSAINNVCSTKSSISSVYLQSNEGLECIKNVSSDSDRNDFNSSICNEISTYIETSLDKQTLAQETSSVVYSIIKDILAAVDNVCSNKSKAGDKISFDKHSKSFTKIDFPTCAGDLSSERHLAQEKTSGDEIKTKLDHEQEASLIVHDLLIEVVSSIVNACAMKSCNTSQTVLSSKPSKYTEVLVSTPNEEIRIDSKYSSLECSEYESDTMTNEESIYIVESVLRELIPNIVSVCSSKSGIPAMKLFPSVRDLHVMSSFSSLSEDYNKENELAPKMTSSSSETIDNTGKYEANTFINSAILRDTIKAINNVGKSKLSVQEKMPTLSDISPNVECQNISCSETHQLNVLPQSRSVKETESIEKQANEDSSYIVHSVLAEVVSEIFKACEVKFGVQSTVTSFLDLPISKDVLSCNNLDDINLLATPEKIFFKETAEINKSSKHEALNIVRSVLKDIVAAINSARSLTTISTNKSNNKSASHIEKEIPISSNETDLCMGNVKSPGSVCTETSNLNESELLLLYKNEAVINSVISEIVNCIVKVCSKTEVHDIYSWHSEPSMPIKYCNTITTSSENEIENGERSTFEISPDEVLSLGKVEKEEGNVLDDNAICKETEHSTDPHIHTKVISTSEYSSNATNDVSNVREDEEKVNSVIQFSSCNKKKVHEKNGTLDESVNEENGKLDKSRNEAVEIVRSILSKTIETIVNVKTTHPSDLSKLSSWQESLYVCNTSDEVTINDDGGNDILFLGDHVDSEKPSSEINQRIPKICRYLHLKVKNSPRDLKHSEKMMNIQSEFSSQIHPPILHYLSRPKRFGGGVDILSLASKEPKKQVQAILESPNEDHPILDSPEAVQFHLENTHEPMQLQVGSLKKEEPSFKIQENPDTKICEHPSSLHDSPSHGNCPGKSSQDSVTNGFSSVTQETPCDSPSLIGKLCTTEIVTIGSAQTSPSPTKVTESLPASPADEEKAQCAAESANGLVGQDS